MTGNQANITEIDDVKKIADERQGETAMTGTQETGFSFDHRSKEPRVPPLIIIHRDPITDDLNRFADAVESVYYDIVRSGSQADQGDPCIPREQLAKFEVMSDTLADCAGEFTQSVLDIEELGRDMLLDGIGRGIRFGAMVAAALIAVRSQRPE